MKKGYNPSHLSKKQRHLKKWIPYSIYCDRCKFWHRIQKKHIRTECQYSDVCGDNCNQCDEPISYCSFLKYIEYGDYPLGEGCNICGVHYNSKKENQEILAGIAKGKLKVCLAEKK